MNVAALKRMLPSSLFLKLSAGYFWYFGIIGLFLPFISVYLNYLGFDSKSIGETLAIATASKIFGPALWAKLADRTGQQLRIIQVSVLLSLLGFASLFVTHDYWHIVLCLVVFSLFNAAILPQLEVLTQNSIRRKAKIYARIRLWGSIGFVFMAILGGEVIHFFTANAFVGLGVIILFGLLLTSSFIRQPKRALNRKKQVYVSIGGHLTQRNVVLFFIVGVLLQISFGPYYNFYALYLQQLRYPSFAVGSLIGVSIVAEISVFIYAGAIFKRISIQTAFITSLMLTTIRWLIMAFGASTVSLMVIGQVFHAASFALFHCASLLFLQRYFEKTQQSRAQAIYVGGIYGIGGAVGAYWAGLTWNDGSGAQSSFILAASIALVGACLLFFMNKQHIDLDNM